MQQNFDFLVIFMDTNIKKEGLKPGLQCLAILEHQLDQNIHE